MRRFEVMWRFVGVLSGFGWFLGWFRGVRGVGGGLVGLTEALVGCGGSAAGEVWL